MANRLGPARNRRYLSFYGFPTDHEAALPTLRRILTYISDEAPTPQDLEAWLSSVFSTARPKTIFAARHMIMRMGLCRRCGEKCELTLEGKVWLDTQNHGIILSLLMTRFDFVGPILNALVDAPKTGTQLLNLARASGLPWERETQVSTRLFWLQALGMVTRNENIWLLGGSYFHPAELVEPTREGIATHIRQLSGVGSILAPSRRNLRPHSPITSASVGRQRKTALTTLEIERIAVECAIQDLVSEGFARDEIRLSAPGMGMDLICVRSGDYRLIEVKGTTDKRPSSVVITPLELQAMRVYPDKMWLYVISGIGGRPVLTKHCNPGALDATPVMSYRLRLPTV